MSRERRAVVHHVQDGGKSAVALLSRSARAGLTGLAGREMVRERVATHSCNAATVTQAGGWNGLPAFSYLAQGQAGRPGGNSEPRELRGFPALVGGATWGTW